MGLLLVQGNDFERGHPLPLQRILPLGLSGEPGLENRLEFKAEKAVIWKPLSQKGGATVHLREGGRIPPMLDQRSLGNRRGQDFGESAAGF